MRSPFVEIEQDYELCFLGRRTDVYLHHRLGFGKVFGDKGLGLRNTGFRGENWLGVFAGVLTRGALPSFEGGARLSRQWLQSPPKSDLNQRWRRTKAIGLSFALHYDHADREQHPKAVPDHYNWKQARSV
jgi:hypothetical protein